MIEGISAEVLLADRGYDTDDILAYAVSAGMEAVIPPKGNPGGWKMENCYILERMQDAAAIPRAWTAHQGVDGPSAQPRQTHE